MSSAGGQDSGLMYGCASTHDPARMKSVRRRVMRGACSMFLAVLLSPVALVVAEPSDESVGPSSGSWPPVNEDSPPATTIEDFGGPVPAQGDVAVQCELDPKAPDDVSPERRACDAPIVFVIEAVDVMATQVAVQCISKLKSRLPSYAKNWKVLGSLTTGNPIAVAIALGAATEGDLRKCGLQGIIAGLPASEQVRNDLRQVLDAVRIAENYLSLQTKMGKVMKLADQQIDPGTLAQDVRDAYMNRREVEGLGKEISSLGQAMAKRFKGAAKDVEVVGGGIESLRDLVETAGSALQDQEVLAEEIRELSRADVAECRIEAADNKIVQATEAAKRSLLQSRQAIANARELRVCIVERIQASLGGVTDWPRAVRMSGRQSLKRHAREFNNLARKIDEFESQASRRSVLLENIARQCRILHDQAKRIAQDIENYERIVRSIEDSLADPALCSVSDLSGRIGHLKSIEEGDCGWRLPQESRGVAMSATLESRRLTRRRNLQRDRQLFETLESDAVTAIDNGAHERAAQILDSMDGMTRSPCLDGSVMASLRNRLQSAQAADNPGGMCAPSQIAGTYKAAWGPIKCEDTGAGLECCYSSKCTYRLHLASSDDGEKLEGTWDEGGGIKGPVEFGLNENCDLTSGRYGNQPGQLTKNWSVTGKLKDDHVEPPKCESFCIEWVCSISGSGCVKFGNSCDGAKRRDTSGGNLCGKGCKQSC